jgi:hypothetical protein
VVAAKRNAHAFRYERPIRLSRRTRGSPSCSSALSEVEALDDWHDPGRR